MNLKITHLEKSFGKKNKVLKDVSFELIKGKIYVLMGANGSGKTTLFNIITGFLKPDRGRISFGINNLVNKKPHLINKIGINRTFQDLRLIEKLTVRENIMLAFKNQEGEKWWKALFSKKTYNKEQYENNLLATKILKQTFIYKIESKKAGEISYGQQKLLTLACCISNDGELFLLDEPVAGISPIYRDKLVTILRTLKEQKKTVLIIEHNEDFIKKIADKMLFLNNGVITEYDSFLIMRNDEQVKEAYV